MSKRKCKKFSLQTLNPGREELILEINHEIYSKHVFGLRIKLLMS